MKTITIGRSAECNITIEHELISRKHALLKLYPSGKIEIVDMGRNGTSVNGIRIQPNVPKRINRNDVVTFAGSKSLDWNLVPQNPNLYLYYAIAAVVVCLLGVFGFSMLSGTDNEQKEEASMDEFKDGNSDGKAEDAVNEKEESWTFIFGSSKKDSEKKASKKGGATEKPQVEEAVPEKPVKQEEKKKANSGPKFVM